MRQAASSKGRTSEIWGHVFEIYDWINHPLNSDIRDKEVVLNYLQRDFGFNYVRDRHILLTLINYVRHNNPYQDTEIVEWGVV